MGECARSGRKMMLKDMVSDGYYPSLIVDPEWYEGKHPQESLPEIEDPVALWRPAPERDLVGATIDFGAPGVGTDGIVGGGTGAGSDVSQAAFAGGTLPWGFGVGSVGFSIAPHINTVFNDPSNWTLIQKWNTNSGDMTNIAGAMLAPANHGFGWSYDGLKFSICNVLTNQMFTFSCSTAFDPDTADATPDATRSEVNPGAMQFNDDGSRVYVVTIAGNEIEAITCLDFVIGLAADESTLSKTDVGFAGDDGGFVISVDDVNVYWEGEISNQTNLKKITLDPAGDLDSFTVNATEDVEPPLTSTSYIIEGLSVLSLDSGNFYRASVGSVRLVTMSTPGDISTISYGATVDISSNLSLGFTVTRVWINPNNTAEVWVGGSDSNGIQLAQIRTNV